MATRLSVALCTLDGSRYLRQQLESIFAQSRRPDQIVLCDDGSRDDSAELAAEMLRQSGVPHRLALNRVRLGVSKNFEQAIRLCECDIVVFSDQDDVWRRDRLAQIESAFQRHPEASLVFSNARAIDGGGNELGYTQWDSCLFGPALRAKSRRDLLPVLLRYPVVCGATMAVRAEALRRCLPIADEWLHDEWIALLCAATSKTYFLEEELVDYRIHEGQAIGAEPASLLRLLARAQKLDCRYYQRQERRFTRLQERLQAWVPRPRREALAGVRGKIAYLRAVQRMRRGDCHPCWQGTLLLLDGSHHRFELGFKSWLLALGYDYAFGGPDRSRP